MKQREGRRKSKRDLQKRRNDGNGRNQHAHRHIEIHRLPHGLLGNVEPAAGNQRAQRQNDRDIDDICAENVADRHRRLLFDDGRDGRHKLWKRGADGDHRNRNDALGYAEQLGKNRSVVNKQIRAQIGRAHV